MTARARQFTATVLSRTHLTAHLVRISLGGPGLAGWQSTGVPDEWVALTVPGQFQTRYYTVRARAGDVLTLDVVVHSRGLVTEWASGDCVGDEVGISEPKGSFALPADAGWLHLVGDLTALPAMARIVETVGPEVATRVWAEVPDRVPGYFPAGLEESDALTWLAPGDGGSRLAALVESLSWPDGPGYFWMAGESAQMRAIRRHLMHQVRLPGERYDVMGYWRTGGGRSRTGGEQLVDPGPIHRSGKARGLSDDEIWAEYDRARADQERRAGNSG